MRVFQNIGLYPAYHGRLLFLAKQQNTFEGYKKSLLQDRYGACHLLLPVDQGDATSFFTSGDHQPLQACWAREHGMPDTTPLENVLLAQIEHHRTEVFYNLDPMRYGSDFVRRLPGSVKHSIAWRAAPSPGADFTAYSLIVCNFPSIIQGYQAQGLRAGYFSPAHDNAMDIYAANQNRPTDVLFVGGYSRHHRKRAEILEAVAAHGQGLNIVFHLDRSRLTRWSENPIGRLLPLKKHRRPQEICAVSAEPVFGLDLYAAISKAKIVLNGAVDMAGNDRGNMRCFEALGCGALMVSDAGHYPEGMQDKRTIRTYEKPDQVVKLINELIANAANRLETAQNGYRLMSSVYSKHNQWHKFQKLVESL